MGVSLAHQTAPSWTTRGQIRARRTALVSGGSLQRNDAGASATPLLNRPYWLEQATTDYPSLTHDLDVDVAVIGAGITGLTAAHLLKQAGKSVALLEMSRIGYGATGYTTAKLAVGHSLVYAALTESYDVETASRYARSNQEAIEQSAPTLNYRLEQAFPIGSNRRDQLRLAATRSSPCSRR